MNWGEVNPVHAYYNGSCTVMDNEDPPSWSTSFKTGELRRIFSFGSALEDVIYVVFVLVRNIAPWLRSDTIGVVCDVISFVLGVGSVFTTTIHPTKGEHDGNSMGLLLSVVLKAKYRVASVAFAMGCRKREVTKSDRGNSHKMRSSTLLCALVKLNCKKRCRRKEVDGKKDNPGEDEDEVERHEVDSDP
ncbi:hypothetical protein Tco_0600910 [Tanacetum coccineum]